MSTFKDVVGLARAIRFAEEQERIARDASRRRRRWLQPRRIGLARSAEMVPKKYRRDIE